jgi:4a-hydroxytetrahydrobiopterin dehydratase
MGLRSVVQPGADGSEHPDAGWRGIPAANSSREHTRSARGKLAPPAVFPASGRIPRALRLEQRGLLGPRIEREFEFKDFREALDFTVAACELAEHEGHHPDVHLSWGRVRVETWTHKIKGLHQNDFILAAKTDELYAATKSS